MRYVARARATLFVPLLVMGAVVAACDDDPAATPSASSSTPALTGDVTVFAASSLTEAFTDLGEAFEEAHDGVEVVINFAGTTTIRTQIEQGARADVFAFANQEQMGLAVQSGVVDGAPKDFATNRLVLIAPAGGDAVASLADLANDGVALVLALPDVPVGNYARQAIDKMGASGAFEAGFAAAVLANVASEEANVRQVAAKVTLGEADAGVVYSTDVTPDIADDVRRIEIPDSYNVLASYPIAKVDDARNGAVADAFISFVLSAEGQAILAGHGFGTLTP